MFFRRKATVLVLLLAAVSARATDIAVLRNGFEIRHERRESKGNVTRLYFSSGADSSYIDIANEDIVTTLNVDPPALAATPPPQSPAPQTLTEMVNAASQRHRVDPDLITSVIYAESNFNPLARSPKGAQGLMQLMPETATRFGVRNPYQAAANIDAGSQYLRELLLRYQGNLAKALAAYNAGPERVEQYRGVPPYRETRNYVARVIRDFNCRKRPENLAVASNGVAAKCPEGSGAATAQIGHRSGKERLTPRATPTRNGNVPGAALKHAFVTSRATLDSRQTSK